MLHYFSFFVHGSTKTNFVKGLVFGRCPVLLGKHKSRDEHRRQNDDASLAAPVESAENIAVPQI